MNSGTRSLQALSTKTRNTRVLWPTGVVSEVVQCLDGPISSEGGFFAFGIGMNQAKSTSTLTLHRCPDLIHKPFQKRVVALALGTCRALIRPER